MIGIVCLSVALFVIEVCFFPPAIFWTVQWFATKHYNYYHHINIISQKIIKKIVECCHQDQGHSDSVVMSVHF